jgi:hypothetical protein
MFEKPFFSSPIKAATYALELEKVTSASPSHVQNKEILTFYIRNVW